MSSKIKKGLDVFSKASYLLLSVSAVALINQVDPAEASIKNGSIGPTTRANINSTSGTNSGKLNPNLQQSQLGNAVHNHSSNSNKLNNTFKSSTSSTGQINMGGQTTQGIDIDPSTGLPKGKISHKYGENADNFQVIDMDGPLDPRSRYVQFTNTKGEVKTYRESLSTKLKLLWNSSEIGVDTYIGPDGREHKYIYRSKPKWVTGSDIIKVQQEKKEQVSESGGSISGNKPVIPIPTGGDESVHDKLGSKKETTGSSSSKNSDNSSIYNKIDDEVIKGKDVIMNKYFDSKGGSKDSDLEQDSLKRTSQSSGSSKEVTIKKDVKIGTSDEDLRGSDKNKEIDENVSKATQTGASLEDVENKNKLFKTTLEIRIGAGGKGVTGINGKVQDKDKLGTKEYTSTQLNLNTSDETIKSGIFKENDESSSSLSVKKHSFEDKQTQTSIGSKDIGGSESTGSHGNLIASTDGTKKSELKIQLNSKGNIVFQTTGTSLKDKDKQQVITTVEQEGTKSESSSRRGSTSSSISSHKSTSDSITQGSSKDSESLGKDNKYVNTLNLKIEFDKDGKIINSEKDETKVESSSRRGSGSTSSSKTQGIEDDLIGSGDGTKRSELKVQLNSKGEIVSQTTGTSSKDGDKQQVGTKEQEGSKVESSSRRGSTSSSESSESINSSKTQETEDDSIGSGDGTKRSELKVQLNSKGEMVSQTTGTSLKDEDKQQVITTEQEGTKSESSSRRGSTSSGIGSSKIQESGEGTVQSIVTQQVGTKEDQGDDNAKESKLRTELKIVLSGKKDVISSGKTTTPQSNKLNIKHEDINKAKDNLKPVETKSNKIAPQKQQDEDLSKYFVTGKDTGMPTGKRHTIDIKKDVTIDKGALENTSNTTGKVSVLLKYFEEKGKQENKPVVSNLGGKIHFDLDIDGSNKVKIKRTNISITDKDRTNKLNVDADFAKNLSKNLEEGYLSRLEEAKKNNVFSTNKPVNQSQSDETQKSELKVNLDSKGNMASQQISTSQNLGTQEDKLKILTTKIAEIRSSGDQEKAQKARSILQGLRDKINS